MSKCRSGVDVLCPFYRKHSTRSISCEGIIPDTGCIHVFRSERERDKQIRIFCGARYEYCEAYTAIRDKYREEEE